MIKHHPPFDLLFDYATGSLPEPAALVVAAHAELCAECRKEVATVEAVGGEMLSQIEPVHLSDGSLSAIMARLDEPEQDWAPARNAAAVASPAPADPRAPASPLADLMPPVLRAYLGEDLSRLVWRKVGGMFEEIRLPISGKGFKATLMRLKPGSVMPSHTHRGREYTLVLAGGYRDNGAEYARGDFSLKDASDVHRPVVDSDEECICLAVLDAPVKLTGFMGRLVNPFLRM